MNMALKDKIKTGRSIAVLGLLLGANLALSGCQLSGIDRNFFAQKKPRIAVNAGPSMPQVGLPHYIVGESFTYDDGRTETVMAINGNQITWRSDQGIINVKRRNFLVPSLSWQTRTKRSKANITGNPSALWPLSVGKEVRFNSLHVTSDNDGTGVREASRRWQCVVEGTEKITVPLGTFDVYGIVCFRYGFESSYWRQTRKYYFSPKIGHYVAREDTYSSRPSKRRELVFAGFNSSALPQPVQATLIKVFQEVMNKNRDGAGRSWRSPDGKITALLTPERTFKDKVSGLTCRDYTSVYNLGQRTRSNIKRACKQTNGRWRGVPLKPPQE